MVHFNEKVTAFNHRFYGEIDDLDKFFGTDDGGNMHFMLKYAVLDNLLINVDHTKDKSAYGLGIEYAYHFEWMKVGARFKEFRINVGFEKYHTNYMANLSLQTANFFEHINFTANVGYDAYYEHQILGFGVDLNANNFIPYFTFTEKLSST